MTNHHRTGRRAAIRISAGSRLALTMGVVALGVLSVCGSGGADEGAEEGADSPPESASAPAVASTDEAAVESVAIADDLGNVEVASPASVIVTTSDEATEMVVALGIEPAGVASSRVDANAAEGDRFADYFLTPDQLGDAAFVGGETLNFEAIAALRPDLIVHAADDDNTATLRDIAPTVVFDIQVPGRWQGALSELGVATGAEKRAADAIEAYDAALADARERLAGVAAEDPAITVVYPNYRGGDDNFVFDANFSLAAVIPELGFDLVGIDASEPAFPGVGVISSERYEDLADGADTLIAMNPAPWEETPSGPFLQSLAVPVLGVLVDEGRPSTGPLSAPVYLERFVAALTAEYGGNSESSNIDESAGATTLPEPAGPRIVEHQFGSTEVPAAPERIVALSEEFLLADLLSLGVRPVASTANDTTFGGLGADATDGIENIVSAEFNIERLAALRPDLILAYPVYIDLVGYDTLNAIAPTVAIGNAESDWRERLELTADVLGVEAAATERIEAIEMQLSDARAVLDGVRVSALSIFSDSFVRVYTDGRTTLTEVMIDVGVIFVPGADEVDGADDNGRIEISLEQFEILTGDVLLLLQRPGVEEEAAASITNSPLWTTLPAVAEGAVITLDRLGYPGADGVGAFASDLAVAVAEVS